MSNEADGWFEQLRARVAALFESGNRKLDELEARREAERADKPWLSRDGENLDLDQVRSRIEWEEQQAAARLDPSPRDDRSGGIDDGADADDMSEAADREVMRLEIEERERASKERLEAIRRELGVDPPPDPSDAGSG